MSKTKAPINYLHSSGTKLPPRQVKADYTKHANESLTSRGTIGGYGLPVAETLKTYAAQSLLERTGFFYDDQYIFPDEETHPLQMKDLKDLTRIELRELYNFKTAQVTQYKEDIANGIPRPEVTLKGEAETQPVTETNKS